MHAIPRLTNRMRGDNLAERYEQTMFHLERIKGAGYQQDAVGVLFCAPEGMEVEEMLPLGTRDVLYGGNTEAMSLHYKEKEVQETKQYVDVMSLYTWVYNV